MKISSVKLVVTCDSSLDNFKYKFNFTYLNNYLKYSYQVLIKSIFGKQSTFNISVFLSFMARYRWQSFKPILTALINLTDTNTVNKELSRL